MLDLAFEAADPHVDPRGAYRYVLYQNGESYPLPDVVLTTEVGTASVQVGEVVIAEVSAGRIGAPRLCEEIRRVWAPGTGRGLEHVPARHVLARDCAVPARLVEAARPAGPDEALVIEVEWRYSYTDANGVQAYPSRKTSLEFARPGLRPPPRRAMLDPDAEREGVPAPIRSIGTRRRFANFAAVDFGTSSSTVTVYDTRSRVRRDMDPGQAARLRAKLAALFETGAPAHLASAWNKCVLDLADAVTAVTPDFEPSVMALFAGLRSPAAAADGQSDPLLDTVCAELEARLSEADAALKSWLAPRLLDCYDEAFSVPPLDTLSLRSVLLDVAGKKHELPTSVAVIKDDPIQIELAAQGANNLHDVKAKLFRPEPLGDGRRGIDGKDATTDDLIAHVYNKLIGLTEDSLRLSDDDEAWALAELVVTFPTITPPASRERLTRIMSRTLDIPQPFVQYDEAVAAALYFLMRDFGGNRAEFGAEALRARSRRVPGGHPSWSQNMLVVDIGAGTTDIALVRLTLREASVAAPPPVPGQGAKPAPADSVLGRYYAISPQVVNSTGHPQLGGNYLTLRVFYWLKAAIADALLFGQDHVAARKELLDRAGQETGAGDGTVPRLAAMVVANGAETPVPARIAPILHALMPTRWGKGGAGDDKARQAFWALWGLAEDIKVRLAAPQDAQDSTDGGDDGAEGAVVLDRELVAEVLNPLGRDSALIAPEGIVLSRADFAALMSPVLDQAAGLARWLVRRSFPAGSRERLDRVMLSGKTSRMPLVAEAISRQFAVDAAEGGMPWDPGAVSVEREYAKQAASIGAAWAYVQSRRRRGLEGEWDQLSRGRSVLAVDVGDVFTSLPCEFVLLRNQDDQSTLLSAGTPLAEVDRDGRLAARREWSDREPWPTLVPSFEVHRPIREGKTECWGTYHFQREAKFERGFRPVPAVWLADSSGRGARVHAQLEIDEKLTPTLHLSQGRPHYLVDPAGGYELRPVLPGDCWNPRESRLRRFPASVVLVGEPSEDNPTGEQVLFPAWDPAPDGPVAAYFPEYLHEHAGMEDVAVPGRICPELPAPKDGRDYWLVLRSAEGVDVDVAAIQVPAWNRNTTRYTATLDLRGRLSLHRGYPPFWRAGTLRDVEAHPGAVLRCAMRHDDPERDPLWDPFNGRH